VVGDALFVANAGDCRAVLCRGGAAIALSSDQNADRPDERERVLAAGGTVAFRCGNWRVGEAGIQVTR
jgi:serine/threonine protein phosphatase PrpC